MENAETDDAFGYGLLVGSLTLPSSLTTVRTGLVHGGSLNLWLLPALGFPYKGLHYKTQPFGLLLEFRSVLPPIHGIVCFIVLQNAPLGCPFNVQPFTSLGYYGLC
ncbi:MAG: hypothetical protein V4543_07810 [Bacteroidota bacterium]